MKTKRYHKSKGTISEKDFKNTLATIKKYKITDSHLLEIILQSGQAIKPLEVKKQIKGFSVTSGSAWEDKMDSFPSVHIGYIKINNHSAPIRIESLNQSKNLIKVLPKVEGPITEAHFVYPQSLKNVARVQAFRNFLYSKISEWKF